MEHSALLSPEYVDLIQNQGRTVFSGVALADLLCYLLYRYVDLFLSSSIQR